MAAEFPLDVDLIDRVEVIRGPGSSLYGSNAFFTVINVITRRGRDLHYGEASFSAGSWDTYSGRATFGHHFTNGVEMVLSGTYFDSQGHDRLYYPEFRDINGGQALNLDWESRQQAFLSLAYKDFTLQGVYGDRLKAMPTGAYGSIFNLGPNWTRDNRDFLELRYRHEWESGWLVEARVSYDYYFYDAYEPYAGEELGLPGESLWNHDTIKAQWWGGDVQVSRLFFDRHHVSLGLEGRGETQARQWSYFENPRVTVDDINSPGGNIGAYLQDEFSIRTNLMLNAGARFDHYNTFGDTFNPRAGLIYSPWNLTTFKGLYGQAFRAPNAYEFDYESIGYVANHDLQPETIRSYELVWEQQLSKPLRLTTSLFYNQAENQIIQVDERDNPDVGGYIFSNRGSTEVKGVETEFEVRWASGLRGRVSYTFADAVDRATGARVSNSPQHVGKLNLSVPLYRQNVFASVELQTLSERLSADASETCPGNVIANFTLFSRELVQGLEVSASVYNLFDQRFSDPVGPDFTQKFIEQDGRAFRLKLNYRF